MSIEKDDKKKVLEFWLDIEAQVLKCVHKKINIFMEIAKDAQHTHTHTNSLHWFMNTFMAKVYATNPSSTRNQWRKLMVCRVGKMMPPNEAQTQAIASQSKYWTPIFFPTCRVSFDSLSLFLSVSTTTNHSYFRSLFSFFARVLFYWLYRTNILFFKKIFFFSCYFTETFER